jgi:predicted porin
MQKTLFALAAAAAISPVFAATDNHVTLYGIIAMGVEYTTTGEQWATKMQSYNSRIGFKGADKLNEKTSVFWMIESQVDTAKGEGQWGWRETWLGIQHDDLGTLRLGHGKTMFDFMVGGEFDMFWGYSTPMNLMNNAFGPRFNNTIAYDSPNWNGFTFNLSYGINGDRDQDEHAPNGDKYALTAKYKHQYFSLHAGYEQENGVDAISTMITGTDGIDLPGTIGSYARGRVKNYVFGAKATPITDLVFGGIYKRSDFYDAAGAKAWQRDSSIVMGQYQMGNWIARAAWSHQFKAKNKQGGKDINSADIFVLGAEYKLSKRSSLFAEYSYIDNNDQNAFSTTSRPHLNENGTFGNPQTLAIGLLTQF